MIRLPSARALTRPPAAARGFTLTELLVVMTVAAVLLVIALPSMRDLLQRNRVAGEINGFAGDLQFARAEAIKRGLPVSLCASSDGSTCLGTNTWQQGWIVFSDADGSGTPNGSDQVLRIRKGFVSGDTFAAAPAVTVVTYGSEGFALNLHAGSVTMPVHTQPPNSQATRCLKLNTVGRQQVESPGTDACA